MKSVLFYFVVFCFTLSCFVPFEKILKRFPPIQEYVVKIYIYILIVIASVCGLKKNLWLMRLKQHAIFQVPYH